MKMMMMMMVVVVVMVMMITADDDRGVDDFDLETWHILFLLRRSFVFSSRRHPTPFSDWHIGLTEFSIAEPALSLSLSLSLSVTEC